jgi:hypothetical protein
MTTTWLPSAATAMAAAAALASSVTSPVAVVTASARVATAQTPALCPGDVYNDLVAAGVPAPPG